MSAATDSNTRRVKIFVRLMNEGTEVSRPTDAIELENGLFQIMLPKNYDPEYEVWEFPPGSTVRCERRRDESGDYLIAVAST